MKVSKRKTPLGQYASALVTKVKSPYAVAYTNNNNTQRKTKASPRGK